MGGNDCFFFKMVHYAFMFFSLIFLLRQFFPATNNKNRKRWDYYAPHSQWTSLIGFNLGAHEKKVMYDTIDDSKIL